MCLVDFCGFYWLVMETVNYLTGWMALINTESYVLRARCTTESQSCVHIFARPEMSVCQTASRIEKNGKRHDI